MGIILTGYWEVCPDNANITVVVAEWEFLHRRLHVSGVALDTHPERQLTGQGARRDGELSPAAQPQRSLTTRLSSSSPQPEISTEQPILPNATTPGPIPPANREEEVDTDPH